MKKIILCAAIGMIVVFANAQTTNVAVGKKIQTIVTDQKTITVSQMGQDMEMPSTSELYSDLVVKSSDGKKIVLTATLTRIKIAITMMGQEIKIDSDDSAIMADPKYATVIKDVNKPADVTIELGKSHENQDIETAGNSENLALVLFLPFDINAKVGTSISDSVSKDDSSKFVNVYTLTESTKNEITVTATSTATLLGTKQQMGMDVKQNMQMSTSSTRIYDPVTGLLKLETKTTKASGTNEMQGMSIPVSMKGTTSTIVK